MQHHTCSKICYVIKLSAVILPWLADVWQRPPLTKLSFNGCCGKLCTASDSSLKALRGLLLKWNSEACIFVFCSFYFFSRTLSIISCVELVLSCRPLAHENPSRAWLPYAKDPWLWGEGKNVTPHLNHFHYVLKLCRVQLSSLFGRYKKVSYKVKREKGKVKNEIVRDLLRGVSLVDVQATFPGIIMNGASVWTHLLILI